MSLFISLEAGDEAAHPSPFMKLKRHSLSKRDSISSTTPPTKPAAKANDQEEQEESEGEAITGLYYFIHYQINLWHLYHVLMYVCRRTLMYYSYIVLYGTCQNRIYVSYSLLLPPYYCEVHVIMVVVCIKQDLV